MAEEVEPIRASDCIELYEMAGKVLDNLGVTDKQERVKARGYFMLGASNCAMLMGDEELSEGIIQHELFVKQMEKMS